MSGVPDPTPVCIHKWRKVETYHDTCIPLVDKDDFYRGKVYITTNYYCCTRCDKIKVEIEQG